MPISTPNTPDNSQLEESISGEQNNSPPSSPRTRPILHRIISDDDWEGDEQSTDDDNAVVEETQNENEINRNGSQDRSSLLSESSEYSYMSVFYVYYNKTNHFLEFQHILITSSLSLSPNLSNRDESII